EGARLLVCDDEYVPLLEDWAPELGRVRAWTDSDGDDTLEALIASGSTAPPPVPESHSTVVILTSGTTGTPKGAQRGDPRSLLTAAALLSKVPFRAREVTVIAAPLFHALGFAHYVLANSLGSTAVLRRKFDAEAFVDDLAVNRATGVVVVPVMLRRI